MSLSVPAAASGRILKTADVLRETSFSRTTLWRRIREGTFPAAIDLGHQKRGWLEREVEDWKAERAAARQSRGP